MSPVDTSPDEAEDGAARVAMLATERQTMSETCRLATRIFVVTAALATMWATGGVAIAAVDDDLGPVSGPLTTSSVTTDMGTNAAFRTWGDDVHYSSTAGPKAASAHGWWTTSDPGLRSRKAWVTVYLQFQQGGNWITVNTGIGLSRWGLRQENDSPQGLWQ